MTLLLMEGFDHFGTQYSTKGWAQVGGQSGNSVAGRLNGNAFHFTNGNGGANWRKVFSGAASHLIAGVALKTPATAMTVNQSFFTLNQAGAAPGVLLVFTASQQLQIQTMGGSVIATSTLIMNLNTYYYIEVDILCNGASGAVKTQINGVADIPLTTGNFGTGTMNTVGFLCNSGIGTTCDFTYDDIYVCDTLGSRNNAFLGDAHVETKYANADGAHSQFTPNSGSNHYSRVNETNADGDTSYVSDGTLNDLDSYLYPPLNVISGAVYGVQTNLWSRKDDATTRAIRSLVRQGGADYVSSVDKVLSTSYIDGTDIWETDPSTSANWTVAGVNSAEFGVKITV